MANEYPVLGATVIGEGEQLIGIVTETDFLAIAHEALLKEAKAAGKTASGPSRSS